MDPCVVDNINSYLMMKGTPDVDMSNIGELNPYNGMNKLAADGAVGGFMDLITQQIPLAAFAIPAIAGGLYYEAERPRLQHDAIHKRRMDKLQADIEKAHRQMALRS